MNALKKMMFLAAFLVLALPFPARGSDAPAAPPAEAPATVKADAPRQEDVLKMLELSGQDEQVGYIVNQVKAHAQAVIKMKRPGVPPEAATIAFDVIDAKAKDSQEELLSKVADIWAAQLTQEDIEVILAFYSTPTWKKLLAARPMILQGAQQEGELWANELFNASWPEIQSQIDAAYPEAAPKK